jgi:PadR family transcriptional regulator PadR
MDGLTGFQRDIVYIVLANKAPHGLQIKQDLDEYYCDRVTRGRVYSNLDTLVEAGYLEKRTKTDRTNAYRLTEVGFDAVISRRRWEEQQFIELLKQTA